MLQNKTQHHYFDGYADLKTPNTKLLEINGGIKDIGRLLSSGPAATLASLLYHFENSQWLPKEILEKHQYAQLELLIAHAYQYSPYFHRRMVQAGLTPQDIVSPEGLRRIPVMTRHDVKQAGNDLYCTEIPGTHMPYGETKTSASTGESVIIRKTAINNLFWQADMMREHLWHNRDFMGRLFVIRSSDSHEKPVEQQGWGNPVNLLFPSGAVRAISVTTDIQQQIKDILAFKPHHLLIHPNNLEAIITRCQQENISIKGIDHIWCFAEMLSPKVRQKAAHYFGASIEDNYSSQEMGIMALQCPDSGLYHVMSENVILEILDDNGHPCKEGDTGKVVVTDLHNFATPLIRYAVGDYAQTCAPCPCGRGLPTLKSMCGRDAI